MTDMNQMHAFAVKWRHKFQDKDIGWEELVSPDMIRDCEALGFKMDTGDAFAEKYGEAVCVCEALEKIVDEIDDIPLLGSAIYSRWRYFNHWAYSPEEVLETENRNWFIVALNRLVRLSDSDPAL